MALSFRHLIACVSLVLATAAVVRGQTAPEPPPAIFQLFSILPVQDMLYDRGGKPVTVSVGQNAYSQPYQAPVTGEFTFYRLVPAPEPGKPPVRVPVVTASVKTEKGAETLIVLYPDHPLAHYDESAPPPPLKSISLDNTQSAQPVRTMRVFSFSSRPVAIKIGAQSVMLKAMQPTVIPYPEGSRTWINVATTGEHAWQRVIGTPQMLAENTRLSLFLNDIPPSRNDPNPVGLSMKKIIETLPSAENPATPQP
jgi:hypothetical protein